MALKITLREVDDVAVVALEGRLVLGEESRALREQLKSMLAAGRRKIVLDMAQVAHIDSAGLATLAAAHHAARGRGASLKLAVLSPSFQKMLHAVDLARVLELYDSQAAAIASFE